MEGVLFESAILTTSSGETVSPQISFLLILGAWEICQFWQVWQAKLHPTDAIDKDWVPGKKWKKGFFSIGSKFKAQSLP